MAIERQEPDALSQPTSAVPDAAMDGHARELVRSERFEVRIVPDAVEIALRPRPAPKGPSRSLWHDVRPRPGVLVSLTSLDDRLRRVRLRAASASPGWQARWVRWTYAVRSVSELMGGDAVAAQDVLENDDRTLTLLLLPGERREAALGFETFLDGQTQPGDFLFEVIADAEEEEQRDTTVGALHLRHPEPALLNYLPGIYREARCPCDTPLDGFSDLPFFQRFLLGFEDGLAPLREQLDGMDRYFGSRTAPPDFLPWLATWAAFVVDENWPELRRRALIREAAELYRWRGTRRGLARYLEIYTGVRPEINDTPFAGMRLSPQTLLGRDTLLGDVPRHTFVVTLAVPSRAAINEQIVRDIIESEKPAHTGYALRIVQRAAGEEGGA